MRAFLLLAMLVLAQCTTDETLTAYGASEAEWQLWELDGKPVSYPVVIGFMQPAKVFGKAPCNVFEGTVNAPYPWFGVENMQATLVACDGLAAEQRFFEAFAVMTESEVSGDTLILRGNGRSMLFKSGG